MNAVWHGWALPMFLFLAILRLSLNYLIARQVGCCALGVAVLRPHITTRTSVWGSALGQAPIPQVCRSRCG